jgi:hypothetical protein
MTFSEWESARHQLPMRGPISGAQDRVWQWVVYDPHFSIEGSDKRMLLGVGCLGQRLATVLARACGGDHWVQSECRKAVAGLTIWVDPIGTGVGVLYEVSLLWEEADDNELEARALAERQAGRS